MTSVLVIGRRGQLSRALQKALDKRGQSYVCVGSNEVDLSQDPSSIIPFIQDSRIDAVINASGFTDVDGAEENPDAAHFLNAMAPGMMALACSQKSIPFIHISTDYVFDGLATTPYKPDAPTNPINVYGRSKLAGENAITALEGPLAILRTSWVYDGEGKNFLTTMLRLANSKTSISVVDDQIGRPTYAGHLADACLAVLDHMPKTPRIFHVSNTGDPVSWAGFTREIFNQAGLNCEVNPVPTEGYPTPAKRPAYSVLDATDFEAQTGHHLPAWQDGLRAALKERR